MPVLADSCPMAKTDIKSEGFLYHVYIEQMQRNAVCTFFCQALFHLRWYALRGSIHAVQFHGKTGELGSLFAGQMGSPGGQLIMLSLLHWFSTCGQLMSNWAGKTFSNTSQIPQDLVLCLVLGWHCTDTLCDTITKQVGELK